jgi:hypothetical protein
MTATVILTSTPAGRQHILRRHVSGADMGDYMKTRHQGPSGQGLPGPAYVNRTSSEPDRRCRNAGSRPISPHGGSETQPQQPLEVAAQLADARMRRATKPKQGPGGGKTSPRWKAAAEGNPTGGQG